MSAELEHALVVFPSGAAFRVILGEKGKTAEPVRQLVGGWFELVRTMPGTDAAGLDVWVVDDYRDRLNFVASYMTGRQLVGPAVLTRSTRSGETVGLHADDWRRFRRVGLELVNNGDAMGVADVLAWVADDEAEACAYCGDPSTRHRVNGVVGLNLCDKCVDSLGQDEAEACRFCGLPDDANGARVCKAQDPHAFCAFEAVAE